MESVDKITLVWNEKKKWVRYKDVLRQINVKPELGFEYDELWVDEEQAYKIKGKKTKLKKLELDSVSSYLSDLDLSHEKEILGIDEKGRYLDRCSPYKCYSIVWDTPPNQFNYIWDSEQKKWADSVPINEKGEFIQRNSIWDEEYFGSAKTSLPTFGPEKWLWNFKKEIWEDTRPLEEQKKDYRKKIDLLYKQKLDTIGHDTSMENKYTAKYQEALAYKKAKYPTISKEYPYIYHECLYAKNDAKTVADAIISKHEATDHSVHILEGFRIAANKKLNDAETKEDASDAVTIISLYRKDYSL